MAKILIECEWKHSKLLEYKNSRACNSEARDSKY